MQSGVTVALATVWLACLVGVISTSIPPRPSVDQYSPQPPKNRHGVPGVPEEHVHRKYWRTFQALFNTPINQSVSTLKFNTAESSSAFGKKRQIEGSRATEVYKLKLLNEKFFQRVLPKIGSDTPVNVASNSIPYAESPSNPKSVQNFNILDRYPNIVPELQVGCEGLTASHRRKRSDPLSEENSYFIQDIDPRRLNITPVVLDLEASPEERDDGKFYEELDELVRLRQQERDIGKPKNRETRGDIQVNLENSEEVLEASDVPLRGDIGAANALARNLNLSDGIGDKSELKKQQNGENQTSILSTNRGVSAWSGSRRLLNLRKREAIDFPRNPEKVESSWGYREKEGADPLRESKRFQKGKRRKKVNKGRKKEQRKERQDGRFRNVNRSYRKNLEDSRRQLERQRVWMDESSLSNERLLQKKLEDYIKKNTPQDVRVNISSEQRRNENWYRYHQYNMSHPSRNPQHRSRINEKYHYLLGRSGDDRTLDDYRRLQDDNRRQNWDRYNTQNTRNRRPDQDARRYNNFAYSNLAHGHQHPKNVSDTRYQHPYPNTQDPHHRAYEDRNALMNIRMKPSGENERYDSERRLEEEYIRRNTPIDIRLRPSYNYNRADDRSHGNNAKPYHTTYDTAPNRKPGNVPERTTQLAHRRDHNLATPVDNESQRRYGYDRLGSSVDRQRPYEYRQHKEAVPRISDSSAHWPTQQRIPQSHGERTEPKVRWRTGYPSTHESQITQNREREREREYKNRYEEYKRTFSHKNLDANQVHQLPVAAQIIIDPWKRNRFKRFHAAQSPDPGKRAEAA